MTELEQANTEAFHDLVSHGGKTLTVGAKSVQGLVQFIEPENAQRTLEDGEQQDAIVQVLKSEWPSASSRKGTTFEIVDDAIDFRIKTKRVDTLFYFFRCKIH